MTLKKNNVKFEKVVKYKYRNKDFYSLFFCFAIFGIVNIIIQTQSSWRDSSILLIVELIVVLFLSRYDDEIREAHWEQIK